jgi:molybdate transport system substrate-binding protein
MKLLHLLSGGAAQGLVTQLEDRFETESGCSIDASFGAVGMMKDSLIAGAPCDVLILTQALIDQLTASGQVEAGSAQSLGVVKTGIAVGDGEAAPDVSSPDALKAALQAARGIYFPDPVKATAGVHFMRVLKQLGLDTELADRLRPFPNGATAMRALAEAAETEQGLLGCTQVTEILNIPGVQLIAPLPKEFELTTVYTAAQCTRATQRQAARKLIELLTSVDAAALRRVCGFD